MQRDAGRARHPGNPRAVVPLDGARHIQLRREWADIRAARGDDLLFLRGLPKSAIGTRLSGEVVTAGWFPSRAKAKASKEPVPG
jgi:hypothetical protein